MHEKGQNRHRDRNRLLQTNNFDSDGDPDSDADLLGCSFLFSEEAPNRLEKVASVQDQPGNSVPVTEFEAALSRKLGPP